MVFLGCVLLHGCHVERKEQVAKRLFEIRGLVTRALEGGGTEEALSLCRGEGEKGGRRKDLHMCAATGASGSAWHRWKNACSDLLVIHQIQHAGHRCIAPGAVLIIASELLLVAIRKSYESLPD